MGAGPLQRILDALGSGNLAALAGLAVVALLLLVVIWKVLSGRKRQPSLATPDLSIDVTSLGAQGPPAGPPMLEFYHVPVRLAAIVLAPAGRGHALPPPNQLEDVLESVLPGLARVVAAHRPLIRRWPAQLSTSGFAHAFFQQVRLPGKSGKGTPWSSVAGVAKMESQSVMAGMVLRTESRNNFGQSIVEKEHEWLGILRVKGA